MTYFDFNKKPNKVKLHSNRTKILTDNIRHQQLLAPWPEQVKLDFKQDQHRFDCHQPTKLDKLMKSSEKNDKGMINQCATTMVNMTNYHNKRDARDLASVLKDRLDIKLLDRLKIDCLSHITLAIQYNWLQSVTWDIVPHRPNITQRKNSTKHVSMQVTHSLVTFN